MEEHMNVMNNSYFYLDYYSELIEKELSETRKQIDVSKESYIEKKFKQKLQNLFKKKCVQMDNSDACICA